MVLKGCIPSGHKRVMPSYHARRECAFRPRFCLNAIWTHKTPSQKSMGYWVLTHAMPQGNQGRLAGINRQYVRYQIVVQRKVMAPNCKQACGNDILLLRDCR